MHDDRRVRLTRVQHVHHLLPHDELEGPREVSPVRGTVHRLQGGEVLALDGSEGDRERRKHTGTGTMEEMNHYFVWQTMSNIRPIYHINTLIVESS